ncbi:hypothetical protein JRO89_XS09G0150200 [Xanthoceras sorbifolium]|uniref:Oligopeptide transporter n=1 Tax=Xanthoceras sorbifolium TaxID=99658 RepID=A0ABQ8HLC2_9ROSI|nr:hypothetical protein JRO89_XS09G0150200 [Xanthoceras sorbifolium]
MNPGPFNIREHVLITIFANSGAGTVYAAHILTAVKLLYKRELTFLPAFLVMMTTQVLGFGWAGIFRKYLVEPGEMWWPSNLVQVSLFRALHEKEKRPKGEMSRNQYFLLVLIGSFAYYVLPGYLFGVLTSISWVCWLAPKSVLVQQLGSGMRGLGIGSIGIDWSTVSAYLGSPLASPWFATANIAVGFCLVMNVYAKNGSVNLSTFFAMTYGLGFATLSAMLVHVLLFSGSDLWKQTRTLQCLASVALAGCIASLCHCPLLHPTNRTYARVILCAFAGEQQPGLNVITEYVIGYVYPERPVANMCFKVYGYISMAQALTFLADFKLGHYMKIPPRAMFMAQVVGTVLAVFVYTITAWWLMGEIPHLCDTSMLPRDSPWTCPMDRVFFDASVIWGLVGPRRIFGDLGEYGKINWFFLGGAIAPVLVWLVHKAFPSQKWIRLIHMPVLLGATAMMPPATAVNFTSWIFLGFLSGFVLFRYRPDWWKRYNYILSGGLDAGAAFMTVLLFLALQSRNIGIGWWGNSGEGCPLASCPTARGIKIDGCPVVA